MTDRIWLSAHVFHHGDTDPLLTGSVLPLLEDMRAAGLVDRRFFLRHWERGPHVRIRLRVREEHARQVRTRVTDAVESYLREHPGPTDVDADRLRRTLQRLSELEHGPGAEAARWAAEPPNTVRWIPYRPEYAKYGGHDGVEVAEQVFDVGSTLAGIVLRDVPSDRARLGVALHFLLLATRALGLDAEGRRAFLDHYHARWAPYVSDRRLVEAWEVQYRHQAEVHVGLVAATASGARVGGGLGTAWEAALASAVERMRPAAEDGSLRPAGVPAGAPPVVALAALVSQYLHTTNNRMNVRPQGECFVAFLAARAAADHAGSTPGPTAAAGRR